MNHEPEAIVFIGLKLNKMIPAAEVAQPTLVRAQTFGQLIPAGEVKVRWRNR